MVYLLGEQLQETSKEYVVQNNIPAIFVLNENDYSEVLKELNMSFEGECRIEDISFCKMETQQDCLYGTLSIPSLIDIVGLRYRLMLFINAKYIVIVDNNDFALRIIKDIRKKVFNQGDTKERFLYNFIVGFMNRGNNLLEDFEHDLMVLDDDVIHDRTQDFQNRLMPIRKQLLILRNYYEQLTDMFKELEEDENMLFNQDGSKYFGVLTNRAERLMDKTKHLLEYATQVKDAYRDNINLKQNENMEFLTIISTIFLPLTLITSWYGMNFENMPELKHGYPFVVILCIIVFAICIIIFKKKKIL
jgi:magnesium transporter